MNYVTFGSDVPEDDMASTRRRTPVCAASAIQCVKIFRNRLKATWSGRQHPGYLGCNKIQVPGPAVAMMISTLVILVSSACSHSVPREGESGNPSVADSQALKKSSERKDFIQALDEIEKQALRERMASGVLKAEMLVYRALEQRATFGQALGTIAKNRAVFRAAISKEKTFVQLIASVKLPPLITVPEIQRADAIKEMTTKTHDLQGRIYADFLEVDRLVRLEGIGDSTELARAATAKIREVDSLAAELTELRNRLKTENASFGI